MHDVIRTEVGSETTKGLSLIWSVTDTVAQICLLETSESAARDHQQKKQCEPVRKQGIEKNKLKKGSKSGKASQAYHAVASPVSSAQVIAPADKHAAQVKVAVGAGVRG